MPPSDVAHAFSVQRRHSCRRFGHGTLKDVRHIGSR
jgi:hypothetical protein